MQLLPEQEPIGLLVAAVRRRIKQAVGNRVRPHRLSPQQFWVLVVIREAHGLSLRDLAERLRLDAPTASRIVAGLVRRKLVRVSGHPRDRRRCALGLTARGALLARELHPFARQVREAVGWGLSPSEKSLLRRGLRRIIANMDRFEQGEREDVLPRGEAS